MSSFGALLDKMVEMKYLPEAKIFLFKQPQNTAEFWLIL